MVILVMVIVGLKLICDWFVIIICFWLVWGCSWVSAVGFFRLLMIRIYDLVVVFS